jgi:hypothetical protein
VSVRFILPLAMVLIACSGADDARDRQFDELTLGRINDVLNITQCAFNGTGVAPPSMIEARSVRGWLEDEATPRTCDLGTTPQQIPVQVGSNPAAPGDVSYEHRSATQVRICGNFRRPSAERGCNGVCLGDAQPYAAFYQARPRAGPFCYEIRLQRGQHTEVGMPLLLDQ